MTDAKLNDGQPMFARISEEMLHSMTAAEIQSVAHDRGYGLEDVHNLALLRKAFLAKEAKSDSVDQDTVYESNAEH